MELTRKQFDVLGTLAVTKGEPTQRELEMSSNAIASSISTMRSIPVELISLLVTK